VLLLQQRAPSQRSADARVPPQCWHGGLRTITQLNESVGMLIDEYLTNGDAGEAERSLHELGAKSYHHEFVRRCVEAAYCQPAALPRVAALFAHMANSGVPVFFCFLFFAPMHLCLSPLLARASCVCWHGSARPSVCSRIQASSGDAVQAR
jgi:MA3 domain